MVEREQVLAAQVEPKPLETRKEEQEERRRRGGFWIFVLGFVLGAAALFALALFDALQGL
jgi:hypothetical protein